MASVGNVMGDHTSTTTPVRRTRQARERIRFITIFSVSLLLSILFMFPFFWTVMSSLKTVQELNAFPPIWIPEEFQWRNYPRVLELVPFLRWGWNSLFVVLMSTVP